MRRWMVGGFEVDGGDDNVWDLVCIVHDLDRSMETIHVVDLAAREQSMIISVTTLRL